MSGVRFLHRGRSDGRAVSVGIRRQHAVDAVSVAVAFQVGDTVPARVPRPRGLAVPTCRAHTARVTVRVHLHRSTGRSTSRLPVFRTLRLAVCVDRRDSHHLPDDPGDV